ncbi:hypothetical protein L1987_11713 [Smallanthus sonchifolius]|uniref:Uncharacterized protein n=1 Tax=Smallanthus sonchifolius TaxID=185202 RepID=A0ACB9JBS0_9ASTR|nr:hypothetical protein L1987_11713 [Smallanthus sonchifolius]
MMMAARKGIHPEIGVLHPGTCTCQQPEKIFSRQNVSFLLKGQRMRLSGKTTDNKLAGEREVVAELLLPDSNKEFKQGEDYKIGWYRANK